MNLALAAKWHKELTGGLARQYLPIPREDDPIAIYESQAAMRVHWVLNIRQYGEKWVERRSYHGRIHSQARCVVDIFVARQASIDALTQ